MGNSPVPPKLFGLPAIPRPKCQDQIRLTMTRAARILLSTIQLASARRCLPRPSGKGGRFHASKGFRGAQSTRLHSITLRIDAATIVDDVGIEIALCPRILRYLQPTLNVFHRYGLTGKNGMGERLNAIELDAVTEPGS